MAKTKEGKIEDYFKQQVEAHGGLTRKAKWLCRRGAPDQFWANPTGRSGFAEIKPPDRPRPDPHQQREILKLVNAGLVVYILSTEKEVDRFIKLEFSQWQTPE